jgi:hypothetical protein
MKTLNMTLVRLLQLLVLLFFTFAVFLWYGCALLIPLTLWMNLTEFFSTLINPMVAATMSLAIISLLTLYLSRIPKLLETFLATGIDLIKLGHSNIQRLSDVARAIRQETESRKIGIVLRN